MTPIEERLRQELHDLAHRLAPGDLRPLRDPPRRNWTSRVGWLAPIAAASAVASVVTGLGLARSASSHQELGLPGTPVRVVPAADPPLVAIAGGSANRGPSSIKLISPVTGSVVKTLPVVGSTGAYALSPDAATVFVAYTEGGQSRIKAISVATGRETSIARGAAPAVSPDGRYLAYSAGDRFDSVAVRDLRTGSTRTLSLSSVVGRGFTLAGQNSVMWLGDGTSLVAVPSAAPVLSNGALRSSPCAQQTTPRGLCVVIVDIRPHGMMARRIYIPRRWSAYWTRYGADFAAQQSIFLLRTGSIRPRAAVQITFSGSGVIGRRATRMPQHAIPLTMAPGGDRLLYLAGRSNKLLWVGTVRDGRLTEEHALIADGGDFTFYSAAW